MAASSVLSSEDDPGALEEWRERAACKGVSIDVFFPNVGDPGYSDTVALAKSICAKCRVRKDCLDYSIRVLGIGTANDDLGIYGGLTLAERRSLVRSRRPSSNKSNRNLSNG